MPFLRTLAAALVLALQFPVLCAQGPTVEPQPFPSRWLQGYVRTVVGDWILYPWAYPGQTKTLLSRATDGRMAVEWEAEPAPAGDPGELITYLWHGGTASGYGAHAFQFWVNGRAVATFRSGRTADDRDWSVVGDGGTSLSFKTTRVGQFNELFGFMWFTAPRSFFGQRGPRFRVVGEAANSQDYYLGPQERIESWTRVRPEEAVFVDGLRALRVGFSNVGPAQPARVRVGDRTLWSGTIDTGYTTVLVGAGPNAAVTIPLTVSLGSATTFDAPVTLSAVPDRAIHLLPHSHVDIGYSDPQPEVERKQWKNLRDAVALGLATASYPPEARFKWNVEGLWAVESYLAQAPPAERWAFGEAVRAGTIGLQANYTNILTGLATPGELRRWTDAATRVRAQLGTGPIRSAMHSDIPGVSWASVAALAEGGVRYFSSGPNYMPGLPDGGDRIGSTLRALGDKPFWWTSPSGEERLLFWMAGRGYSWFHGLNTGRASDRSRDSILDYVKDLAESGYRYDLVQVRYTIGGDNGPVDPGLPDFVKRWNDQFSTPRLVISTADELFAEFEKHHGTDLPVRSGDMTPYWEDGALSSAAEEALVRAAARRLQHADMLAVLRGAPLPPTATGEAWRNILLWREHTWGAADSVTQPDRPDVVAQWEYKRRFATEADRLSRLAMTAALPAPPDAPTHVDIINTLAWSRSGLVYLPPGLSRGGDRVVVDLPPDAAGEAIAGEVRRPATPVMVLPSQRLHDGRLAVWLEAVPALSSVRVQIVAGAPGVAPVKAIASPTMIDSGRVRLTLDQDGGSGASLIWTGAPGHDFVLGAPGVSRYLYVAGRDPAAAVASTGGRVTVEDAGPLVATVRIDGPGAGVRSLTRRFGVVAGSDQIFSEVEFDKTLVRSKESAHIAFPFNVPGGVVRADLGAALVEFERDQLPGSCRDFVGVQSAIDVSGPSLGISLVSLDAPLIELGAISDERHNDRGTRNWPTRVTPGASLFAYLLNNHWHTNYKADQSGPMRFRFVMRPHGAFDALTLRRLSDEHDYPLLAAGVTAGADRMRPPFSLEGDPVTVAWITPHAGDAALMAGLFNPSSTPASVTVRPVNTDMIVGGPAGTRRVTDGRVTVPPRATRVIRLSGR